jgi:hypothetical protein
MPTSVRLDPRTEGMLSRLARTTGLTRSEIIRKAVGAYVSRPSRPGGPTMPYEILGHLLGCVRGGPPDLSERTGERFRRLLVQRKRR